MSLDYRLDNIADNETLCWETYTGTRDEMVALVARCTFMGPDWAWTDDAQTSVTRLSPTTSTLIFLSMQAGLGSITEKNWREFYTRVRMIEAVLGAMRASEAGAVYFTPDEVRSHVGLVTNVSDESKAKFNAKIARIVRENAERTLRA